MSRRSIYRPWRVNTSAYGPKTDSTIQHWVYDYVELATSREEEAAEGPQRANTFHVKTWQKIETDDFKPIEDGESEDKLELVNRIQAAADEIAKKDNTSEAPSVRSGSEAPEQLGTPSSIDTKSEDPRISEMDQDVEMQMNSEPSLESETPLETPIETSAEPENSTS